MYYAVRSPEGKETQFETEQEVYDYLSKFNLSTIENMQVFYINEDPIDIFINISLQERDKK